MSQKPIGAVSRDAYGTAKVAQSCGVPYLIIAGVSEFMSQQESVDVHQATLDKARPYMNAEDFKKFEHNLRTVDVTDRMFIAQKYLSSGSLDELKKMHAAGQFHPTENVTGMGQQPIHLASRYGCTNIVEWLLVDHKCDPNAPSFNGKRPLHYAAAYMKSGCVKRLLELKADPTLLDSAGQNPVQLMCPSQFTTMDINKVEDPQGAIDCCKLFGSIMHTANPALKKAVGWREVVEIAEEAVTIDKCTICNDRDADTMVLPCQHVVVCRVCSAKLQNTADRKTCVQCRQPIESVLSDEVPPRVS